MKGMETVPPMVETRTRKQPNRKVRSEPGMRSIKDFFEITLRVTSESGAQSDRNIEPESGLEEVTTDLVEIGVVSHQESSHS